MKKFSALLQKNSKKNMQPFSLKKSVAKKNQKKIATQNLLQKKVKNILQQKTVAKKNRKYFATEMLLQKKFEKKLQQKCCCKKKLEKDCNMNFIKKPLQK